MRVQGQMKESVAASKAESLKGWETASLDGKPLLEAISERTPILLGDKDLESVSMEQVGQEFVLRAPGRPGSGGAAAVPVSEDGYFLTAGHIVQSASSLILVGPFGQEDGSPQVHKVPARVVWEPDGELELGNPASGPDIAIIHAIGAHLPVFMIDGEPPQVGDSIIIAGWPFKYFDSFPEGAIKAAGQVQSVDVWHAVGSYPAYTMVHHDAPMVEGDSGGPVLDRKGYLVGINSSFRGSASYWQAFALIAGRTVTPDKLDYISTAIMPDPNWLREVIEQDRIRSNSPPRTAPEPP